MSRIEPRIESFEVSAGSADAARAPRRSRPHVRRAVGQWLEVLIIAILVFALALAIVYKVWGFNPLIVPQTVWGRTLVMGGLLVAYLAQVLAAVALFRVSVADGLLALLVPGFFVIPLRRQGHYAWFVGIFAFGLACLGLGTILLS